MCNGHVYICVIDMNYSMNRGEIQEKEYRIMERYNKSVLINKEKGLEVKFRLLTSKGYSLQGSVWLVFVSVYHWGSCCH